MILSKDKFKSVTIFYFTGSGNTQLVSRHIATAFEAAGYTARTIRMEDAATVSIQPDEVVGIGFPVIAFTAIPVVFDFIDKLPTVNGTPVFCFCTLGGLYGPGLFDNLRGRLLKKGFAPVGRRSFRMPLNIFFGFPETMRKQRIATAYDNADRFVATVIGGTSSWGRELPGTSLIFFFVMLMFRLMMHPLHQKFLKIRIDHNRCTRCGLCVSKCPAKNLSLGEQVIVGVRCQYCFRCVAVCPHKATFGILSPKSLHYRAEGAEL